MIKHDYKNNPNRHLYRRSDFQKKPRSILSLFLMIVTLWGMGMAIAFFLVFGFSV